MQNRKPCFAASVIAASILLIGCDANDSTLVDCPSQLMIHGASSSPPEVGRYLVTVGTPASEFSLELEFSGAPVESGEDCGEGFCIAIAIDDERGLEIRVNPEPTTTDLPDELVVEVDREGVVSADIVFPIYEDSFPNGEDHPACSTASATVDLDIVQF